MGGRLEGKVAFITGIARGQGRSHAVRLAEEGADIIGLDICADLPHVPYAMATSEDLDETVALVEKHGRRIVAWFADVADRRAVQRVVDDGVAELGHLDVVVANAGVAVLGDYPIDTYFTTLNTLLVGVVNTVAAAYPHLDDGASIIATGSVAALIPGATDGPATGPGGRGYSFAKRTIAQFVRETALVMAPRSIRVNAVHPTNCDTDLLHTDAMYSLFRPDLESPTREDAEIAFPAMQAMPIPYIQPLDVSNAVVFLASDESRYITGMQLRVDAGSVIKQLPGVL
jgi:SDR family mycofactocin-dependent oxidoreductase